MLLRLFKTVFPAALALLGMYWVTVLVRDYAPRLSIDGTSLFAEPWQQLSLLVPLYLAALLWFSFKWRGARARARQRVIELQRNLEHLVAPSAREVRLRKQIKQWRLQARVEGVRPAFLLIDWSVKAKHIPEEGEDDVSALLASDNGAIVDLDIVQVGRYGVLSINSSLLSQAEDGSSRLWQCLLDELKSARRSRCALVGGVLVLNAEQLQVKDGQDLQASNLRERLEELARAVGKGLPIQAIVTGCESLPGYALSISGLPVEERELVIDFPLTSNQVNMLRMGELIENRLERLDESLLNRLQMEPLTLLRTQLYGFASLWRQFSTQVQVFFQTVFHAPVRLQSVRFSAKSFAQDQQGIVTSRILLSALQQCGRHGAWRTPFKRAAGWLRAHTRYWVVALIVCLGVLLANNFRHHSRIIDHLEAQQKVLEEYSPVTASGPSSPIALKRLNIIAGMVNAPLDNWPQPSLWLYQYQRLESQVQGLYDQSLKEAFLPYIVVELEKLLSEPSISLYDDLRLYLMLGGQGRFDRAFVEQGLRVLLNRGWGQHWLGGQRKVLEAHLHGILQQLRQGPVLAANEVLVEQARLHIAREAAAPRVYRQLSVALQNPSNKELSVSSEADTEGLLLIASRSGAPLTRGVPWLYTRAGYEQLSRQLQPFIVQVLRDDNWVMGLNRQLDPLQVREQVLSLYLRDYIQQWERFIADLKLAGLNDPEQLPGRLERLSRDDSVLSTLLEMINRETRLNISPQEQGLLSRLREGTTLLTSRLGMQGMAQQGAKSEQNLVTRHFSSLHQMTYSIDGRPSPLDNLREALAYTGTYLAAREMATSLGLSSPEVNALANLRSLTDRLPLLIRPLFADIVKTGGGWVHVQQVNTLASKWAQRLGPYCEQVVEQRYPFDRSAKEDVALMDFNQLFAPTGLLHEFHRLYPQLPLDNGSQALVHSPESLSDSYGVDYRVLAQFKRAEQIGNGFFPQGATQARIDFELSPVTMDEDIASFRLTLDERQFSYSHGPLLPSLFTWPSQALGSRLSAVVTLFDGRTLHISEEGPWAWFRLLDRGVLREESTRDVQWLTLSFDGHKVVLQIRHASHQRPFAERSLNEFRCPYSPTVI